MNATQAMRILDNVTIAERMAHSERFKIVLTLTPREYDVFLLLGEGFSSQAIAVKLGVANSTIETFYVGLKRKLGQTDAFSLRSFAARFLERLGRPHIIRHAARPYFTWNQQLESAPEQVAETATPEA